MKAARVNAYGEVDVISYDEVPKPSAGQGEVLVKVEASGLNPVDNYVRKGAFAQMVPMTFPYVPSLDLAGTVEAVGAGVSAFKAGDRVIGKVAISGPGASQEYVVVQPGQLAKINASVSFEAGATLPLAGLTARQAVAMIGPKKGDRILVTGALGAVGRAALQYLKELGAVPVAAVRAERKAEAEKLGFEAIVLDGSASGRDFVGAFNTVGGDEVLKAAALVKDGGKVISALQPPDEAKADKRVHISNFMAKDETVMLRQIADAANRGDLAIPVAKTFKLAKLAEAHTFLANGHVGGKIIIVP